MTDEVVSTSFHNEEKGNWTRFGNCQPDSGGPQREDYSESKSTKGDDFRNRTPTHFFTLEH